SDLARGGAPCADAGWCAGCPGAGSRPGAGARCSPCRPPRGRAAAGAGRAPGGARPPVPGVARTPSPRAAAPGSAPGSGACRRLPRGDGPSSRSHPGCARALPVPGPPLCPGRMLVRPDDGPIDEVDGPIEPPRGIGPGLDGGEHAVPDAREPPAAEAAVQRGPGAVPLGHVAPGHAGGQLPDNPVEDLAMVLVGPAGPRPLGRQQRRELGPLSVGKFMASHAKFYRPLAGLCTQALVESAACGGPSEVDRVLAFLVAATGSEPATGIDRWGGRA